MNICIYLEVIILLIGIIHRNYTICFGKIGRDRNYNIIYWITIIFILSLFIGLRGNITTDYSTYKYSYELFSKMSFDEVLKFSNKDIGFRFITWVIGKTSLNYVFYFTIIAFLTVFFYLYFFINYSEDISISVLMFLTIGSYFTSTNIMRNILAASIFSLSYKYVIEKKFIKYVIITIITSFIHLSAIIMIPAYFFFIIRWNKRNIKIGLLLYFTILLLVINYSNKIVALGQLFIYSDYGSTVSYGMNVGLRLTSVLKVILIVLFIFFNINYIDFDDRRERVYFNVSLFYLCIYLCATQLLMIQRFSYYLEIIPMVFIPLIIKKKSEYISPKKLDIYYYLGSFLLVLYSVASIGRDEYKFFWQ